MASQMQNERPLLLLPVMTGALLLCADLLRHLPGNTWVKPIVAQREGVLYLPRLRQHDLHRDIWVIDNTICSGLTLQTVLRALPSGTRSAVLFGLPCVKRAVDPAVIGMEIASSFVVGYGADLAEGMRGLPELHDLREGA